MHPMRSVSHKSFQISFSHHTTFYIFIFFIFYSIFFISSSAFFNHIINPQKRNVLKPLNWKPPPRSVSFLGYEVCAEATVSHINERLEPNSCFLLSKKYNSIFKKKFRMDCNGNNISENPFLKQDNAGKRLIRRRPIIIRDTDTKKC
ncbi:hypothetical protein B9Z55_023849 [Caenorhabditis nigoni]|nr:hypothetical protein B9Z55_023849 [Caenorhabditis nigoni]